MKWEVYGSYRAQNLLLSRNGILTVALCVWSWHPALCHLIEGSFSCGEGLNWLKRMLGNKVCVCRAGWGWWHLAGSPAGLQVSNKHWHFSVALLCSLWVWRGHTALLIVFHCFFIGDFSSGNLHAWFGSHSQLMPRVTIGLLLAPHVVAAPLLPWLDHSPLLAWICLLFSFNFYHDSSWMWAFRPEHPGQEYLLVLLFSFLLLIGLCI